MFEILSFYPLHIVLTNQTIVILFGFAHINSHIVRNRHRIIVVRTLLTFTIVRKDIVDIGVVDEVFGESVFVADRQFQLIVDGIDKHGITQDMTKQRQQERISATIDTFEECTLAEPHHTLTCTRKICYQLSLILRGCLSFVFV